MLGKNLAIKCLQYLSRMNLQSSKPYTYTANNLVKINMTERKMINA